MPPADASDSAVLERELLADLRTPGVSIDDELHMRVPTDGSGVTAVYTSFSVPVMSTLDERDVFIVLASAIAQTTCEEAQVHVESLRSDGTVDTRGYLWADNRLEVVIGRQSDPSAMISGQAIATIDDMDAARIRAIALGDEDVPRIAD